MNDFNKEDFRVLRQIPRSNEQKLQTAQRIQQAPIKRSMPYIATSIGFIVIALFAIVIQWNIPSSMQKNLSASSLVQNIELGMTQTEVEKMMEGYDWALANLITYKDSTISQYEIAKQNDYLLMMSGGVATFQLDFEAMLQGAVEAVIYIYWDEHHTVDKFFASYVENDKIYTTSNTQNLHIEPHIIYPQQLSDSSNIFLNIDELKQTIHVGMTMSELERITGDQYSTSIDGELGTMRWYYEFGKQPDFELYTEMDFIDAKTFPQLLEGKIQATLHVTWDTENTLTHASIFYVNKEEQSLREFYLFEDGYVKDEVIYEQ